MLYFLDTDPQRAARLLADKDVHSVEALDMLTYLARGLRLHVTGPGKQSDLGPWVMRCQSNWDWTTVYVQELLNEHLYRFGRLHPGVKRFGMILGVDNMVRRRLPRAGCTIPPMVFKADAPDLVLGNLALMAVSYVTQWRWFYGASRRGAIYTKRTVPDFIEERRVSRERRRAPHKESEERRHEEVPVYGEPKETRVRRIRGSVAPSKDVRVRRVRPGKSEGDD